MQSKVDVVVAGSKRIVPAAPRAELVKSPTPDDSWSNRELADYAQSHGIDLQGAKRKDAKLAAIAAAAASVVED